MRRADVPFHQVERAIASRAEVFSKEPSSEEVFSETMGWNAAAHIEGSAAVNGLHLAREAMGGR
jgi:hypothetical protein